MLPSDEAKAVAELENEGLECIDQPIFELALLDGLGDAEELEVVTALENLVGPLGQRHRQSRGEVMRLLLFDKGCRLRACFDLIEQDVATPTEMRGRAQVVKTGRWIGNPRKRIRMVTPGDGRQ